MHSLWSALLWPEWRHHPGRQAVALLAIALGVALAFAVHLINTSALAEFGAAVRSLSGQADFELRGSSNAGFDEAVYARVAAHPAVALASPVVEIDTYAVDDQGKRVPLRVLGLDALVAPQLSPALLPRPQAGAERLALLDPQALFLNAAARRVFSGSAGDPRTLRLQTGAALTALAVRGEVGVEGPALAVLDIAGAQAQFGWLGRLSRIDVRLAAGASRAAVLADLALPATVRVAEPDEAALRTANMTRSYRVNLTVLSLVALFTGGFLVFSVQSLAVAKRVPQLALLGVLGLSARERLRLVLTEAALLGLLGSGLGLVLGAALAWAALHWLGGDLGSGVFGAGAPVLQFSAAAAAAYGVLGVLAALAGGWLPARQAAALPLAQSLKGLGGAAQRGGPRALAPALLGAGVLLAFMPPLGDVPVAAYAAVACLLFGGIAGVPAVVGALLRLAGRPRQAVALLAVERARDQRHSATIAVAGVVASLSLAVALTVMVASFRLSVDQWLERLLPADLYARSAGSSAAADSAYLKPEFVSAVRDLPGVTRLQGQRLVPLQFDARRAPVSLIARPLPDPQRDLPLVGALAPAQAGLPSVYASEAFVALYGGGAGTTLQLPLPGGRTAAVRVRAVWRDYARQQGALAIAAADWQALTGDARINDLALWLAPGTEPAAIARRLGELIGDAALLDIATPAQIRALSLRIFDRSFAVTTWLQAVAIAIGLFGIAASFSAQVLARRREFGALQHLGFSRGQVLRLVAGEGLLWTGAGTLLGLVLGLAVSLVLVFVVNPQSFHWTMELAVPWARLAALAAAVLLAGALTAWIAGRAAASRQMALAVKEDW